MGTDNVIGANALNTVVAGIKASSNHKNSFVFNSSLANPLATTKNGQFLVNATGGIVLNGGTTIQGPLSVSGGLSYEGAEGGIIEVAGPQGEAGSRGPKGDTGDQGIQGVEGSRGPEGPEGPQGEGIILGSSMLLSYDREDATILGQGYSVVDALRQETEGDANAPFFSPGYENKPAAVWTGSKMIAWGVFSGDDSNFNTPGGAVYDTSTRKWSPMSAEGGPNFNDIQFELTDEFGSLWPRALWTGSKMIVEGVTVGSNMTDLWQGWIYDLEQNTWSRPAEGGPVNYDVWGSVWTGSKLIVLGDNIFENNSYELRGAIYDPEADAWTEMSPGSTGIVADAAIGPEPEAVWMGDKLFVGAEKDSNEIENSIYLSYTYDPVSKTWTSLRELVIPDELTPSYLSDINIIWTGSKVIVGWIFSGPDPSLDGWVGYAYDPVSEEWSRLAEEGGPSFDSINEGDDFDLFWTGSKLIVGANQYDPESGEVWQGYGYDPEGDSWTKFPTMVASSRSGEGGKVNLVGNKLVVWNINDDPYPDPGDMDMIINGEVYDTELGILSPIPYGGSPNISSSSIDTMIVQSTGSELFFWGRLDDVDNTDLGAIFDPNAPSAYAWRRINDFIDGEQIYYIYGKVPE